MGVATPARVAKALTLWRRGEKAMSAIHLALARLPPIELEDAYRLHLADLALDAGVTPKALLREIGCVETLDRLLKYDPNQPRVPQGQGSQSGQWTGGKSNAAASSTDAGSAVSDHPEIAATSGMDAICEAQYQRDLVRCRGAGKASCYAQAAQRYAACLVGKQIPPLNF